MFEWIAGAAGLAAAGVASYGAIAPESELFGKTLHRLADNKQLALTFDDGPNDPHTMHLLDVADLALSRRTPVYWWPEHIDVSGDWPTFVVAHGSCGVHPF